LNTLPKENTPPYIFKNLLKNVLENQNEFQELYASKSDEGVGRLHPSSVPYIKIETKGTLVPSQLFLMNILIPSQVFLNG
jgi:hypothetical protein